MRPRSLDLPPRGSGRRGMNQGQFLQSIIEGAKSDRFSLRFSLPGLDRYYRTLLQHSTAQDPQDSASYLLPIVFADWATKTLLPDEQAVLLGAPLSALAQGRLFDGVDNQTLQTDIALRHPRSESGRWLLDVAALDANANTKTNSLICGPSLSVDAIITAMNHHIEAGQNARIFGFIPPADVAKLRKAAQDRFAKQALRYWSKIQSAPSNRHFFYLET